MCADAVRMLMVASFIDLRLARTVYKGRPRAVRRRHGVGGCAPINFGRRRWRAAGPKNRRRRGWPKEYFSKIPEKISFYFSKYSDDPLSVIENCNKITTQQQWHRRRADNLSAARRSTKVDGGAHKLSAAARPTHGSIQGLLRWRGAHSLV